MPASAEKLLDLLAVASNRRDFAAVGSAGRLVAGTTLPPPSAVFPRHVEEADASTTPA
jgi:methionyl-tRNA synthetase